MDNHQQITSVPSVIDQQYHDHLNQCRCCFRYLPMIKDRNSIQDWHRDVFKSIAGIEMIAAPELSSSLCKKCINLLTDTRNLSGKVAKRQKEYYEFMENSVTFNDLESQAESKSDSKDKLIKCDLCEKMLKNKWTLAGHQKNVHDNKPHKCNKCNAAYPSQRLLSDHYGAKHEGKRFSCPVQGCEMKYRWKHHAISHLRHFHHLCDDEFSKLSQEMKMC